MLLKHKYQESYLNEKSNVDNENRSLYETISIELTKKELITLHHCISARQNQLWKDLTSDLSDNDKDMLTNIYNRYAFMDNFLMSYLFDVHN